MYSAWSLKSQCCAILICENEFGMQRLFLGLIGFFLLVKTCFSPKFKSLHPADFGDNLCQFM